MPKKVHNCLANLKATRPGLFAWYSAAAVCVQLEVCLCVAALGWAGSIKLGIGTSSWHGGSAGESGCGSRGGELQVASAAAANFET